jgi:membrane protein
VTGPGGDGRRISTGGATAESPTRPDVTLPDIPVPPGPAPGLVPGGEHGADERTVRLRGACDDGPETGGGPHTRSADAAAARPEEPVLAADPTVKLTAAGEPRPRGARGAWLAIKRTVVRAWDDNIFSEAAAAAFWQTLSLPPLLLGLLGSLGYIGSWFGPDTLTAVQEEIVRASGNVFSRNAVDEIIAPTVQSILTTGRSELVSLGFVISLWSGSSAMSSFVDAITRAHSQYGIRNAVWQRTLALLMYLVGLVAGIIALPLLALGPDRLPDLLPSSWRDTAVTLIGWLYYPGLGLLLMLALTTLYRLALPAKPPWYRGIPGALLAAVVFLVGVTGLRVYISWLTTTGYTYGALAAPIAFLLAAFFIGLAIVLGAHFNAAVQHYWPKPLKDRRGTVEQRGATRH